MWEEEYSFSRSAIVLASSFPDVFEKNGKKNKTTSVYRPGSNGSRKARGAHKRHSCLPRVPSLPADVLWGSFVTHSIISPPKDVCGEVIVSRTVS